MRQSTLSRACALALLAGAAACGDDQAEADIEAERAEIAVQDAPADGADPMAAASAYLDENAARDGVETLESGLQVETLTEGEGPAPAENSVIRLNYDARFADGRPFDSSAPNGAPIVLPSYQALQLPGLIEGVAQMKEGGEARFTLPPALAFGEQGAPGGMVGPGEVLIFDIELVEVIDPEDEERMNALREEEMARMAERQAEMQAQMAELAEENAQASEAFLAERREAEGVEATESGLLYEAVETSGSGTSPTAEDQVTVQYRGTLPTGEVFDSSYDRGQPATFPLGGVIAGWTEGLQLMETGDTYRFYIPSDLAYGETGTPGGPIGPNQALVFEVELLEVTPPAAEAEAESVD